MRIRERGIVPVGRKDVLVGRVDLVRALSTGGVELQDALADLLSFEREPVMAPLDDIDSAPVQTPSPQPEPSTTTPVRVSVGFWQAND